MVQEWQSGHSPNLTLRVSGQSGEIGYKWIQIPRNNTYVRG